MIDLGEYNLRLCIVQTCDNMVVTFKSIFRGIYYQQDYIVMKLATPKKHEGHTPTNQFIHTLKELNFNRSQKNTQNVLLTPKTSTIQHTPTSRLMAERYINDLFPVSQEKSRSVHQVNTASIKQARNVNKYYQIQFLKPYNEYDRMLTGLSPRESNDAQNQRQSKLVSDLTTKFKKDYTIGKTIGEGPYAEVRVAYHRRTNKKVAIKIYQKAKLNQIGCKKTVKRQIKILQALSHPNIVRLIDVAETNHHLSLIMEYLPGISLAAALKQQTSRIFPQSQCRLIIKQLARALMYLHSLLIAHRDIKLQNIILDQYSQPKLIDFGFSTCIKEGTKVSIFCGTPNYMAPEIIQRREYRGQNADIWALGVIMFTMLVGYFPYQGITDNKLYAKIMKTDYPTKDIKAMQSAHDLISKIFIVNPDKRITAPQILQHPWIKNEQRQENRSQLNSTIKSKRIDEKSKQRSHSKRSQRQCVSERKRQFEIERVKQLSSTQRNLNKKPMLNEKPCKRDKSVESSNSFVLKQNQNCRRQAAQKDKNMKTLTFLKLQFQKCDAQKTPAKSYRF